MSATRNPTRRTGVAAGLTAGLSAFIALMLLMAGVLQVLEGIAVLVHGDFFAADYRYAYRLPTTAYGITHLLLGLAAVGIGVGVLQRLAWARYAAIAVAFVSAVANFLFIPYYPLWAILLVVLHIAIIWALAGLEPRR
jgi:hypothetical protein